MSDLVWEPAREPDLIPHMYGDRAMAALEECFGPYPIMLRKSDLPILKALSTAAGQRPLDDIVWLVERHGDIRLWLVDDFDRAKSATSAVPHRRRPAAGVAT